MAVALLIPAYEPGEDFVAALEVLSRAPRFETILVVNDGSSAQFDSIFSKAASMECVRVIQHDRNRGKGAALKAGLRYALEHFPDLTGVVTADADGQHLPEDILRVAERLEQSPQALVLGVRAFAGEVPWRSRFGNQVTCSLARALADIKLTDTQTGLRGVPLSLIPALLRLPGDRYDFELEMLLTAKRLDVPFEQLPIQTVYEPGNRSSHFRWFLDSVKVCAVLAKDLGRRHLALLALLASAAIASYGFATGHIFSQTIWFPAGFHRVELFLAVFALAFVPLLFFAGQLFRPVVLAAVLAATCFAVGPAAPAAVLVFALSTTALGTLLLAPTKTTAGHSLLALLAGVAILISVEEALVRVPWNYPWVYGLVLALPIVAAPAVTRQVLQAAWSALRPSAFRSFSERAATGVLTLLLLAHWLIALKPEVSTDGLSMHLAIADGIAWKHRFAFDDPRHYIWSVMPMGGDWCFTLVHLLGGEFAVRLLNLTFLLILVVLIFSACKRFIGTDKALWVAALFSATPLVEAVTGSTMIENIQAAMLFGGVVALWSFRDGGRVRSLYAAALCFGTALHIKLGSLAFAIPALLLLVAEIRRNWKRLGPHPAWVCTCVAAIVLVTAAPPYVIAAARTGNPLFPFANGLFHSRLLPTDVSIAEHRYREPLRLRTPYDLTFHTNRFYEGEDGSIGFAYLLLIPGSVFLLRRRAYEPWSAAVIAFSGSLIVLWSEPNARYLYPAFPLLHVTIAGLFVQPSKAGRAIASALFACALALNALLFPTGGWYHKSFYSAPLFTAVGRKLYLEEQESRRLLIDRLNHEHEGETVFLPEDSYVAGIHAPVFRNHWHDWKTKQALDGAHSLDEVLELLRRWGVQRFLMPARAEDISFRLIRELASTCIAADARAGDALSGHLNPFCKKIILSRRSLQETANTIYDDTDPRIRFAGSWTHSGQFFLAYGDTVSFSNVRGAKVRFPFEGTEVIWVYTAAPNRGIANVLLDGQLKTTLDLFSSKIEWLSTARFSGLSSGPHTIEVLVTGEKRSGSSDSYIDVDAFETPSGEAKK